MTEYRACYMTHINWWKDITCADNKYHAFILGNGVALCGFEAYKHWNCYERADDTTTMQDECSHCWERIKADRQEAGDGMDSGTCQRVGRVVDDDNGSNNPDSAEVATEGEGEIEIRTLLCPDCKRPIDVCDEGEDCQRSREEQEK